MPKWERGTLRLKPDYRWTTKPGYSALVADRGALRFDIPKAWVVVPEDDGIKVYDRRPPDDDCRLQFSVFPMPPAIDWSGLSLKELLANATEGEDEREIERGPVHYERSADLELAWRQIRWLDPVQQREAWTRHCLARGAGIHSLITLDMWPEDAPRLDPGWAEVLRSMRLGE